MCPFLILIHKPHMVADVLQTYLLPTHFRHALFNDPFFDQLLSALTQVIKHFFITVSEPIDQLSGLNKMIIHLPAKSSMLSLERFH